MSPSQVRRFGIALFDGVEELDWVGPWEVLTAWEREFPEDGVEVFTMGRSHEPIRCSKGARVLADFTWTDHPAFDALVFPGGRGTRAMLGDEQVIAWIRDAALSAAVMVSVCTGALVFADAGLLNGRRATTHWSALDRLRSLGDAITVDSDARFVDDGNVITAAGVSAGIDVALHLVDRFGSRQRAVEVRRAIQYDPEPPV
jgi:transcriptional regulator GlxA family with amidase domain